MENVNIKKDALSEWLSIPSNFDNPEGIDEAIEPTMEEMTDFCRKINQKLKLARLFKGEMGEC